MGSLEVSLQPSPSFVPVITMSRSAASSRVAALSCCDSCWEMAPQSLNVAAERGWMKRGQQSLCLTCQLLARWCRGRWASGGRATPEVLLPHLCSCLGERRQVGVGSLRRWCRSNRRTWQSADPEASPRMLWKSQARSVLDVDRLG